MKLDVVIVHHSHYLRLVSRNWTSFSFDTESDLVQDLSSIQIYSGLNDFKRS